MRLAGLPHNPILTRAIASALVARLPLVMMMLSLVLLVRGQGFAYWVVGLITACLTVGTGLGAPLLGRLADRVGAVPVLLVSGIVAGTTLLVIAAVPGTLGGWGIAALAFVAGCAEPPVNAVLRALMPRLADGDALRTVYGLEAAFQEILFVAGPPAVALIVLVSSPRVSLAVCGLVLAVASAWFTAVVRPHVAPARPRRTGSVLASVELRLLVAAFALTGMMFGAIDISTVASMDAHGHRNLAGVALGVWAVGSLVTGVVVARMVHSGPWVRLPWLTLAMGALTAPLIVLQADPVALCCGLFVQGCCIAATLGTVYELVPKVAAHDALTEAFAWTSSFILAGFATGAAVTGAVTGAYGAGAGFALAAAPPLLAAGVARALAARAARLVAA
ncbi:MAG: MFS transporter [Thermoleophilia bacterium]|nr:MFS transporter [Thermoleophilia bacterium]